MTTICPGGNSFRHVKWGKLLGDVAKASPQPLNGVFLLRSRPMQLRLIPQTIDHRQPRIFRKPWVSRRAPAQMKDRSSIGAYQPHVLAIRTEPDGFAKVKCHPLKAYPVYPAVAALFPTVFADPIGLPLPSSCGACQAAGAFPYSERRSRASALATANVGSPARRETMDGCCRAVRPGAPPGCRLPFRQPSLYPNSDFC